MNKSWIFVILTCLAELVWVYGFNTAIVWWHWVLVVGVILIDFYFLSKACENLPTGTVYAIFAGVGTVGTSVMDVYLFGGSINLGKIIFISLIVLGVIGLKLADNKDENKKVMKGAA
ncbi:paired small multidrug resistance pump [Cytobacillus purgationiresistens]|uniref:Paired small multidrug resistance pump n=2 Tax=Cytobacillus purgationiresistens TaxID=863449 RepID=A0ABU0AKG9_9BACI|nr:paired small multidrug resistance pump [Cytobacillus purgationiresistens]